MLRVERHCAFRCLEAFDPCAQPRPADSSQFQAFSACSIDLSESDRLTAVPPRNAIHSFTSYRRSKNAKTSKQWFYPMEGCRKDWPVDLEPQPYQDLESVASLAACPKFETATLVTMMSLRLDRWSSPEAVLLLRQATNRAPRRFHKESRW